VGEGWLVESDLRLPGEVEVSVQAERVASWHAPSGVVSSDSSRQYSYFGVRLALLL